MFQDFESPADAAAGTERLAHLRALLGRHKLDAVLVPRADKHQAGYVSPAAERLKWLTGFSGSAGMAVVGRTAAALFVDGRYTVQARRQVDAAAFEVLQIPPNSVDKWLLQHLAPHAAVGFDPWLHTVREIERLEEALAAKALLLKPLGSNLVDRLRGPTGPAARIHPVLPHPLKFAGKPASQKIADVQKQLESDGQDAVVLTLPDSVMWLFNIRGGDIRHTPVALAFAVVPAKGKPDLFIDGEKIGAEARTHLEPLCAIRPSKELKARLASLKKNGRRVRLDAETAAFWFVRALGGRRRIVFAPDPCSVPKARKNAVEIKGARVAHQRDGVAMVRFLAWLDKEAASGTLDEIAAAKRLEDLRRRSNLLRDISFDTISGSGPHGAIVHYRVTHATNRTLQPGELFLIDSGGQYLDGTTDITRTVAIGTPTDEMRRRFTLVLTAHIAIATARFPKGTRGVDLDPLARRPLWQDGLDFDHGTGHGVGSYLAVHEGPQSLSKRGMAVLEPGMIVSNEPGYYKEGAYGIRIENLVLVTEPEDIEGGEREMMGFETLTLCPIDRRLVAAGMLSAAERSWLNDYHTRVEAALAAKLGPEDRAWLAAAAAPI